MIKYMINEIFWSAQGEGAMAGYPSIFIRLAGCSLKCDYCDTKNSWLEGKLLSESEILEKVEIYLKEYPESRIVLTGGEPLEQDLFSLVEKLKKMDLFVSIETNGVNYQKLNIDWWTVSPKDVADFEINDNLKEFVSEIKLVVNPNLTINVIKRIRKIGNNFPIFLQPQFFDTGKYGNTYDLYKKCQRSGIKNILVGFQLHRIYDID
ncbi:MAG: 7-carboxy-7-deazaguanine synthase QueE [Acidobacteriota bacterium]